MIKTSWHHCKYQIWKANRGSWWVTAKTLGAKEDIASILPIISAGCSPVCYPVEVKMLVFVGGRKNGLLCSLLSENEHIYSIWRDVFYD